MLKRFRARLESIGKEVALCKPAPGFIGPRLQSLVMSEAARMVEEGTATPADIDHAVRYGFGFRARAAASMTGAKWTSPPTARRRSGEWWRCCGS